MQASIDIKKAVSLSELQTPKTFELVDHRRSTLKDTYLKSP